MTNFINFFLYFLKPPLIRCDWGVVNILMSKTLLIQVISWPPVVSSRSTNTNKIKMTGEKKSIKLVLLTSIFRQAKFQLRIREGFKKNWKINSIFHYYGSLTATYHPGLFIFLVRIVQPMCSYAFYTISSNFINFLNLP